MKPILKTLWSSALAALVFLLISAAVFAAGVHRAGPQINVTATSGYIITCQGTASATPNVEQFTVSGNNLLGDITLVAPANFEISTNGITGYSNSLTLANTGGNVLITPVYVRSSSTAPAGKISGNIVLSSQGATNVNEFVIGTINIVPTVTSGAPSQTVIVGGATNPVLFSGPGDIFTWTNDNTSIGLAASGTGNIPSFTAINPGNTPVTATITVTSQQTSYAYIGNVGDNTISVINTATNKVVQTLRQINDAPTGFAVRPDGKAVFITDNITNDGVSTLSPVTNTEVTSFAYFVRSAPVGIAVSNDGNTIYVAYNNLHSVYAQDPTYGDPYAQYAVGGSPIDVTINPQNTKLFITNSAAPMAVVNLADGTFTTVNSLGNTYSSCISPNGSSLYVTLPGDNAVAVFDVATNSVIKTIPVGTHPEGINISPDGRNVYVTNNGSASVSVINTLTNVVTATIPVGQAPYGVCVTSDGQSVYVTNQGSNSVSVINTTTNSVFATIPVGASPASLGNFILPISGCPSQSTTCTIEVDPKPLPVITESSITGSIAACAGTASADPNLGYVYFAGNNLAGPVMVNVSGNFEVSLNSSTGYTTSLQVDQTLGPTGNITVYVRSAAAAPAGNITGSVSLSSINAVTQTIPLSARIAALPYVNAISNQTVTTGNSTTAVSFSGTASGYTWTNDTPAIGLAASGTGNIDSFTAINSGRTPITATITVTPQPNGTDMVCKGKPVTFTITVAPVSSTGSNNTQGAAIPNAFTPNGDGINDTWQIGLLQNYPNCTVEIFNKWGEKLYASVGYSVPWDGTYKGAGLPVGTYYYIINLKNGTSAIAGWVAIIR